MADNRNPFESYYKDALELLSRGVSPEQVLRHVDEIQDEDYRDGTLAKLSRHFAAQGQVEDSLRFCQAIHYPLEHADAMLEVGRELRKINLPDSAKAVLRQAILAAEHLAPNPWDMPAILVQISEELWTLSEKNEALELVRRAVSIAKSPPQPFEASKALAGCVRLLARWGHGKEAAGVAELIESPQQRETVLQELQGPFG